MNTNDFKETQAAEENPFGDGEQVEVLVEDLFIEQYPESPMGVAQPAFGQALSPAARPRRARAKRLVMGLLAIGALAVVTMVVGASSRRNRGFSVMMRRLRHAF